MQFPTPPALRHVFTVAISCVLVSSASLRADLVDTFLIGEGDSAAEIQFDFSNGNSYLYLLQWNGDALSGRDVFDVIAQAQFGYFDFTVQEYEWGEFLTGVEIGNDIDSGTGSTPPHIDYWHYWTAEASSPWEMSMIGFSDRMLADGARDAWVFGSDAEPATIPSPAAGVILLALRPGRRRGN